MELLVYKSRNIILDMLNLRDYNVNPFLHYSIDEINLLSQNKDCDFTVIHNKLPDKFIHVKYILDKNPNKKKFENILNEEFHNKDIDFNNHQFIFILPEDDNENSLQDICNKFFDLYNGFSQVFYIKKLCFNITKHIHVPLHEVLNENAEANMLRNYNITKNKLPYISRNDQVAKFIGLHKNQIVKITRNSLSGGEYIGYRLCK